MVLQRGRHLHLSGLGLMPLQSHENICVPRRAICDGHNLALSAQPLLTSVPEKENTALKSLNLKKKKTQNLKALF